MGCIHRIPASCEIIFSQSEVKQWLGENLPRHVISLIQLLQNYSFGWSPLGCVQQQMRIVPLKALTIYSHHSTFCSGTIQWMLSLHDICSTRGLVFLTHSWSWTVCFGPKWPYKRNVNRNFLSQVACSCMFGQWHVFSSIKC